MGSAFKRAVRARMAETGEPYTKARAALLEEQGRVEQPGGPPGPDPDEALPRTGSLSSHKAAVDARARKVKP